MIRRRLVATVSVVLFVTFVVAGASILLTLEDRLLQPIDAELDQRADQLRQAVATASERDFRRAIETSPAAPGYDESRRSAVLTISRTGNIRILRYAGRQDDQTPPPDVNSIAQRPVASRVGSFTVGSTAGPRYALRSVALNRRGDVILIGQSLVSVDQTIRDAREIMVKTGLIAVGLAAGAVWFDTRRRFRPLEAMVETAGHIAAGDLSRRTDLGERTSEVGQLGAALDSMLDQIEDAVAVKTESEERMRRFIADASHELRTPLTSVRGYAELYRRGANDDASVERGMARIESEAQRMEALVEDLLLLARLDQRRPLDLHDTSLNTILLDAAAAARAVEPSRPIHIDVPGLDVVAPVDERRIRQVVDNLIANIRSHTPATTTMSLQLHRTDGAAVIEVKDDGPGMDSDAVTHVFERFWQAEGDQSAGDGAGLGLAIVHAIVTAHGGTISVDSTVGHGTTITIELSLDRLPPNATELIWPSTTDDPASVPGEISP